MEDKAHFSDFSSQKPIIQLFISFCVIIIAGTLLFYLFLLSGALFFNTEVSKILSVPSPDANSIDISILKYMQVSQQIAMFVIPAIFLGYIFKAGKASFLKLDMLPQARNIIMVILLTIMIIPLNSYMGLLNSKMVFHDWLSGIGQWMRTKEDTASALTGLLIKTDGINDLVINIFILAIIPAIAEELVFRGILQQILCKLFGSHHTGIWITAIFFSAVHMQFFGFIPRLILGLSFGYLFFWTGNLWLPIIAHFINNLTPVLMSWFFDWNEVSEKASDLAEKQILLPIIPAIISVACLYYFWTEYRNRVGKRIDKIL